MIKRLFKLFWNTLLIACGAIIISGAWRWVQMMHKPRIVVLKSMIPVAAGVFVVLFIIYLLVLKYLSNNTQTRRLIKQRLPEMFFVSSSIFLSVFGKAEWQCLLAFAILSSGVVYYFWYLFRPKQMLKIWLIFLFFYSVVAVLQFFFHHYYILDLNVKFTKAIPLLRTLSVVLFWLAFALTTFYAAEKKGRVGQVLSIVFILFFGVYVLFSGLNIGILSGSGLFISPIALQHAEGASNVIWGNQITFIIISLILISLVLFCFLLKKNKVSFLMMKFAGIFLIALWFIVGLLWSVTIKVVRIPGIDVANAFYEYYKGDVEEVVLNPVVLDKLKNRFGISYNTEEFSVAKKDSIYTGQEKLLPEKLLINKPNVLVVFAESFSSKLTDVYNSSVWHGKLTPALKQFADDKNTTVFKNYYNSSTPTITGLLSLLCSFLPPTGHEEIANSNRLMKLHLSCLPNIMDEYGGYKTISYITAVNKSYAHKDSLYMSAGIKEVYGTEELKKYINEETKAWGFSDHQMFNVLPDFLRKAESPFLITISTIDSHQPYNMAKDMIQYNDGASSVLNSFHTTDDAFGKFWKWFQSSEFATNTIVVVVADHAAFPTAYRQVPEYAKMEKENQIIFYDENLFMINIPDTVLKKEIDLFSSELDVTPTILHILNINAPNTFDGHSIFDDREEYPNLLGMHEFGLYINQIDSTGNRHIDYQLPANLALTCDDNQQEQSDDLTLCEFYQFYKWKRQMLEQGRLWMK